MVYNTPNVIQCGDFFQGARADPDILSPAAGLLKEHRILGFGGFEADISSLVGTSTLLLLPGQLKQIFSLM